MTAEAVAADLAARERAGPSLREHPAQLQILVSGLAAATKLPAQTPRACLEGGVRGGRTQASDRRATVNARGGAASALGGLPAGLSSAEGADHALAAADEPSAAARAARTANDRKSALRRQAEEKVKEADALVGCRAAPLRSNLCRPSSHHESFRGAVGTGGGVGSHLGCCHSPCAF